MRGLLIVALLASACVKADTTSRFTPAWEPFDPNVEGWAATRKVLLCADCQFQNLYSQALPERNLSAEAVAATAIRPPQLDLFSPEVLKWILTNGAEDEDVVLHLGDAANLATTGEFRDFVAIMDQAKKPWFMAPGNHDVFYFGVYAPKRPELPEAAAYRSGEPMRKDIFIRLYVSAILRQDEPGCRALAEALGIEADPATPLEEIATRIPDAFDWAAPAGRKGCLLSRISWEIDQEQDWRSYILQGIDLSGEATATSAILMDSCQYSRRPTMAPNAWSSYPVNLNCGLTGEMLPDQFRKIRAWLEDSPARGKIFLCHHPFEALSPPAKTNLGWLWREYEVAMMVTAHTHAGYFAHHELGPKKSSIELNIGSTTDWPMEWRTLQGFTNVARKKIYIQSKRSTLVDALQKAGGFFRPEWEIPIDAPDDYRSYKQGQAAKGLLVGYYVAFHYTPDWLEEPRVRANKAAIETEESVKRTLLWTYYRLIHDFPTDDAREPRWPKGCGNDTEVLDRVEATATDTAPLEKMVALLEELAAFEKSRHSRNAETGESTDAERARYKISQAAWASRFMNEKGRRLRIEDDLINVEWAGTPAQRRADAEAKK